MRTILAASLVALLAACGGGSDAPEPSQPEVEPNGDFDSATPMTPGTRVVATISSLGDVDVFSFTVPAGGRSVRFQTFDSGGTRCDPVNETVDPWIEIYNPSRVFVDEDDDTFPPWCEDLTVFLPEGTNYVMVGGFPPVPFTYTLRVTLQ